MLHSFYTEIEKLLEIIAVEYDGRLPQSPAWHRELLAQMAEPTDARSAELLDALGELLAFRHLFRGASIVLMRWNKLAPLVDKVPAVHAETVRELELFVASIFNT